MDRELEEIEIEHHRRVDYVLGLHFGTILCIILNMALILLLSECRVIYFGCFWLLVWFVLFVLFVLSANLRSLYPGNWVMAIIINVSGGCSVGLLMVTNADDNAILWTGAHSFVTLAIIIALGTCTPCKIRPHVYLFILFVLLIFVCTSLIVLMYLYAHYDFSTWVVYCLVIVWVFPFIIYQSQQLHGVGLPYMPYDDMALGITFFISDFHIIFSGYFWSIILAKKLKEFKIEIF